MFRQQLRRIRELVAKGACYKPWYKPIRRAPRQPKIIGVLAVMPEMRIALGRGYTLVAQKLLDAP
jgi:hypothetical protein